MNYTSRVYNSSCGKELKKGYRCSNKLYVILSFLEKYSLLLSVNIVKRLLYALQRNGFCIRGFYKQSKYIAVIVNIHICNNA
ncbi:hypothetical protein ANAPC5_00631 [Anaplasma phagocytophilum]|nr:hypothetical protein ANAPC2_00796 [Anaplasma phagocytophilum]SBO33473.1 hypothetical protein ANAPC3_01237 [Anaplasma phagocytophilum]SBO33600.1 hypothetical protein ANAPC4_01221 [Anaplasma phagocytophilum]SCV63644.1 hypothetical protein ANAPC5_00631 [Anaplasma phagocytophilum]